MKFQHLALITAPQHLSEAGASGETQIFSWTFRHFGQPITYSFVVKLAGQDGMGRPVWVGKCMIYDASSTGPAHYAAVVMRLDGSPVAGFYSDTEAHVQTAADLAIKSERKAYGKGHKEHMENWTTYTPDSVDVDGYDYEAR